jgi:hypothetical protein
MNSNPSLLVKNNRLVLFIATSIIRKILTSFDGRTEYRRLRWVVCSRTCLTKREANLILLLLKKEGFIETSKPQANSARIAWLTPQGRDFLQQQGLN